MTDWYVRPLYTDGTSTFDGSSYANAFSGLTNSAALSGQNDASHYFTVSSVSANIIFSYNSVPIWFTTTGTLPTGLTANTVYFTKYRSVYNFYVYSDYNLATPVLFSGGSGFADHTVHLGINWNSITSGDTVYLCGNFGHDETGYNYPSDAGQLAQRLQYACMLSIPVSATGVTFKKHASYDCSITPALSIYNNGDWTDTGTNGVYYTAKSTSSENVVIQDLKNAALGTLATFTVTDKTGIALDDPPTVAQLNSFTAGSMALKTVGGVARLYLKSRDDCDANPNNTIVATCQQAAATINAITFASGTDNVTLDGISCYGGRIYIYGSSNVTVKNCTTKYGYHGVYIYADSGNPCDNVIVENCTFDRCAEGVYSQRYGSGPYTNNDAVTVRNCTITNIGQDSDLSTKLNCLGNLVDCHGVGIMGGINHSVTNNYVYNASSGVTFYISGTDGGTGDDGPMTGTTSDNYFVWLWRGTNANNGIEATPANGRHGVGLDVQGPDSDTCYKTLYFTNNIVVDAFNCGARLHTQSNNSQSYYYNNTFYHCGTGFGAVSSTTYYLNATFENNIIASPLKHTGQWETMFIDVFSSSGAATMTGLFLDYNLYYNDETDGTLSGHVDYTFYAKNNGTYLANPYVWATYLTDIRTITSNVNQEANTIRLADPLFQHALSSYALATDFKIRFNSTCKDAGDPALTTITNDYFHHSLLLHIIQPLPYARKHKWLAVHKGVIYSGSEFLPFPNNLIKQIITHLSPRSSHLIPRAERTPGITSCR